MEIKELIPGMMAHWFQSTPGAGYCKGKFLVQIIKAAGKTRVHVLMQDGTKKIVGREQLEKVRYSTPGQQEGLTQ